MELKDLNIGDKVSYQSVIGVTEKTFGHKVENISPKPNDFGCDVAWITGKSGCVGIDHLELTE